MKDAGIGGTAGQAFRYQHFAVKSGKDMFCGSEIRFRQPVKGN